MARVHWEPFIPQPPPLLLSVRRKVHPPHPLNPRVRASPYDKCFPRRFHSRSHRRIPTSARLAYSHTLRPPQLTWYLVVILITASPPITTCEPRTADRGPQIASRKPKPPSINNLFQVGKQMGSLPAAGVRETPRWLFPTHSYHSTLTSTARETTRGVHTVSQRNDMVGFRCWSLSAGPRRLVLVVSITDRPYPMFALSPSRIIRSTGFCPLSRLVCSFRHSVASWSLLSSSNLLTCRPCDPPKVFASPPSPYLPAAWDGFVN